MIIPVVDLFAGAGGLGEGFCSYSDSRGRPRFRVALSIEKDGQAHQTGLLRALYRQWAEPPAKYWAFLRGELGRTDLANSFPSESAKACREAVQLALGPDTASHAQELIADRVDSDRPWVLIGGPPCQAYSLVGRARNRGVKGYTAEKDERQTLYVEYLQVLADHAPPVFVMENVKGLLSATFSSQRLFDRIRSDLEDPARALVREGRCALQKPRYRLRPLVSSGSLLPGDDPRDFVVRAEEHGLPQARHRVLVLGIREDVPGEPDTLKRRSPVTVKEALHGLPRLRSGLSDTSDTRSAWLEHLKKATRRPWFRELDPDTAYRIRETVSQLRAPRADRGGEYLPAPRGKAVGTSEGILNHSTRSHLRSDLDRYLFASTWARLRDRSAELSDFPTGLLPAHDNVQQAVLGGHFADRFRVQVADRPGSTVTSHISKDGHYYIHFDPTQCRSLTVREAARLQTFPDDFFFCGPRTVQYQQVGNAVPVELARQIAGVVAGLV